MQVASSHVCFVLCCNLADCFNLSMLHGKDRKQVWLFIPLHGKVEECWFSNYIPRILAHIFLLCILNVLVYIVAGVCFARDWQLV